MGVSMQERNRISGPVMFLVWVGAPIFSWALVAGIVLLILGLFQ